ncbi:hypothetical protein [Allorhodopirellula solitaria]|uniref:Uncharacterized protein n=1 Tax=Allorhodopirellula solitaria TaxID=2527987 RepID=A0A5C5X2H3_9BACT|nr:hypothetical protein [Allorhodopirellula solitaria]TWT56432.1 hypothetical protein CA85_42450 [Allorhodopirellula solitaria]
MKNEIKQDYRAAVEMMQSLQHMSDATSMSHFDDSIEQCKRWQRRLEMATQRNWPTAARDASDRLHGALDILRMRATHSIDNLKRQSRSHIEPTATLIFQEIQALRGEFDAVTIERSIQRLTVTTSSIVLDGVLLGSFEIRLNWKYIKESSPFDVIALEPNEPASGEGVTHPHVQSDSLCEGEGSDAIRRALDEGRLYDFFCIVDQILRTYNSGSAYVQLDDWNGVNCRSCGDTVDSDQALACSNCETELCMECSTCCDSCCERYCEECASSCESCGDDACKMCLKSCDDCGESFCPSCLYEGTCDDCLNNENAENAKDEPEQPCPAVQPVCVGKASVPA